MIISKKRSYGLVNEVTEYLDKYLIGNLHEYYYNYIYEEPSDNKWLIRVPGATRGNILIENGVIKHIELYDDSFCYRKEVLFNLDQFIGKSIDLI